MSGPLDRLKRGLERAWLIRHRWAFIAKERPSHRSLTIGEGVAFNVPVRGGGRGGISIGRGCQLGFLPGPRVGSGEILLQARRAEAEVTLGAGTWIGNNTSIVACRSITLGLGCRIGDLVAVYDADFHEVDPVRRNRSDGLVHPVWIGDNVWLGSRVVVLKGVTIGENSVVGAMSLVTRSIPPNCVAAGVPARVIRNFD